MQRFTLPRDLYHGKGALEALKNFEGKQVWKWNCLKELNRIHLLRP